MADSESEFKGGAAQGASNPARRNMLVGSGALLVGGLSGRATAPQAATHDAVGEAVPQAAPPLPWPWARIDPMEAGTRTYQAYLTQNG